MFFKGNIFSKKKARFPNNTMFKGFFPAAIPNFFFIGTHLSFTLSTTTTSSGWHNHSIYSSKEDLQNS